MPTKRKPTISDKKPAAAPAAPATPEGEAPKPSRKKLKIIIGVAAVLALQCVLAFLFLAPGSSPAEPTAHGDGEKSAAKHETEAGHDGGHGDAHGKSHGDADGEKSASGGHGDPHAKSDAHGGHGDGHGKEDAPAKPVRAVSQDGTVELDLGEFSITVPQPKKSASTLIYFHLWGTVPSDVADDFEKRIAATKHRFREQVIMAIRNARPDEFTDPTLVDVKARILERAREVLGKKYLQAVVISDFSYVEN